MTFSELYNFCLGELQIKPAEFWNLTSGEIYAMSRGLIIRNDIRSANFRELFALYYNSNCKPHERKSPARLWPLTIDAKDKKPMTAEEMYERNRKIINNEIS